MTDTKWKAECELKEAKRYLHQMCMAVKLTKQEIDALVLEVEKAQTRLNEME